MLSLLTQMTIFKILCILVTTDQEKHKIFILWGLAYFAENLILKPKCQLPNLHLNTNLVRQTRKLVTFLFWFECLCEKQANCVSKFKSKEAKKECFSKL